MKLTIEPTGECDFRPPKIEITVEGDVISIDEAAILVRALLIGWGFHQKNVDEVINTEYSPVDG